MQTIKPAAVLAVCFLAISAMTCNESDDGASGEAAAAEAISSLAPESLLADDETLLANWASVFEEINSTLDGVSDAASAETAVPQLDALVDGPLARLRELREDGTFQPEAGETAVAWLREHNRFVGNVMRLSSNPAVQPILEEPLERLMSFFEPAN